VTAQVIGERRGLWQRARAWFDGVSSSNTLRLRLALLIGLGLIAAAWRRREPSVVGLLVVLLGMAIRLWASGHLHKRETLAVSGPYRWVRHPLYAGTLVAIAGACVLVREYWAAPVALAIMIPVYLRRIAHEEQDLRRHFGPAYDDYCARVPRLIPRPWPALPGDGSRFSIRLAIENRWHHGMAVVIAGIIVYTLIEDLLLPYLGHRGPSGDGHRRLLDAAATLRRGVG
jgi:protein-S-isoprenylcysteine O-methyltransferase Ste14